MTAPDDADHASSTPDAPAKARTWPAILAVTLVAFALRLLMVTQGLPEFQEEAWPFREALEMWGWTSGATDLNPHRFHYPSLTFYLHFLIQKAHLLVSLASGEWQSGADYWVTFRTDPSPMIVPARTLGVMFDVATVGVVVWIGERLQRHAGLAAGLVLAFSPTLMNATHAIVTDTYMTTLAIASLAAMLVYARGGTRRSLIVCVVLIGLATGAKYPAAAMLIPLAWVLAVRHRLGAVPLWAGSAAGAFVVFLMTTPYAILDFETFWRDLGFVRQLPGAGHLGRLEGTGLAFHAMNLLREVGPLCLLLLPLGLVRTFRRPLDRPAHVTLWLALLVFAMPIFFARVEAARYLVAVVPFLVLASAVVGFEMVGRVTRQRGIAAALLWAGFLLPPVASGVPVALRSGDSTQVLARHWFEENVGLDALILQEAYGASLLSHLQTIEVRGSALFQSASESVRSAYESRPWFRVVQLPLTTVGPGTVVLTRADGVDVTLQLVEHSVDFNVLSYDPRLFTHADYVVTSSAVRNRFMQNPTRFAAMTRLYAMLDSAGVQVQRINSSEHVQGPDIVIYRLGDEVRSRFAASGILDPLWWGETIPRDARLRIEEAVVPPDRRTGGALRDERGTPAAWLRALNRMYASLVRSFAHPMSLALVELDRAEPAARFAAATLEMLPADVDACLIYTTAVARLERWDDGLAALERTVAALGEAPAVLRTERVQLLLGAGLIDDARNELIALSSELQADDPLRGQVDELLRMVGAVP